MPKSIEIYRTYEVLIEETIAETDPKCRRTNKPPRFNADTTRALRVTNDIFQAAMCYYIFLLIGMAKDAKDATGERVNPLWHTLTTGSMKAKTESVLKRLNDNYPDAPWHIENGELTLETFLSKTYDWKKNGLNLGDNALLRTYEILRTQASGEPKKDSVEYNETKEDFEKDAGSVGLKNLKIFAGNWMACLCNDGGDSTIPGNGVFDILHRQLKEITSQTTEALNDALDRQISQASSQLSAALQQKTRRIRDKISTGNKTKRKLLSESQIEKRIDKTIEKEKANIIAKSKDVYSKTFSSKTRKFCSLEKAQLDNAQEVIKTIDLPTLETFPRLRYGARDNSIEYPIYRYLFIRKHITEDASIMRRAEEDVWGYIRDENPEKQILDANGAALVSMPYCELETEAPLFPFFTNCLGIKTDSLVLWREFDKRAFMKASEEVFKYKIRSDKRRDDYNDKREKIEAMERDGCWEKRDDKGRPVKDKEGGQVIQNIGGIHGDPRKERIDAILGEIGFGLDYCIARNTIGGWRDLREDFLKAERKAQKENRELDSDTLEELVDKAQSESAGGFGSAALFRKLCEPDNWCVWQKTWENKQDFHPENFLFWYSRYSEERAELDALVEDVGGNILKPISITLPGTRNRHGETSVRPFSFELSKIEPAPQIDLFDKMDGKYKQVVTNKGDSYPLTLSYRRLKRDRITTADGKSDNSFYHIPLIAENADAPNLYETAKNKDQKKSVDTTAEPKKGEGKALKVSASLLPPKNADEFEKPFHLSMAFPVPVTKLHEKTPKISGEKSIRFDQPKNDFFPGLYFRWPVDIDTETIKKEERKRIWCATDFEPLHILSVDLGVRFAGAWCRAEIAKRKPTNGERVISSPLDDSETGKIVFDIKEVGTFRLQGEDVKIWKKHKGDSEYLFGEEPWGSAGRKAKPEEIAAFKKLAIAILPESTRAPLPDEAELKFFPQLGAHLQFRLARRIGQLRFLFNLRWRAIGKSKKVVEGGEPRYEAQTGKALCALQRENRFRALGMLYFLPRNKQGVLFENINDIPENERGEEESCIKELRKALVSSLEKWDTLVPEGLFKKARTKVAKDALKSAQAEFRKNVLNEAGFNWQALADEASRQIDEIMATLKGMDNGRDSIVARVAHFIWPLRGKEWVWCQCSPCANGVQSHIDYSLNSERNENISGMRGLNMRRIELFQEFRRTLQSIAKQERRYYRDSDKGLEPSVIALGGVIHEPAAAWLRRINEFRDQRVDQTAHLILAEALGLKLKNPDKVEIDGKKKSKLKSERDLHGRYERSKDKPIVSAIVLENLSRYRMSLDRSRFENRQLMEWSHRAILLKLQDMAKVFGIQIFTVDARFSSRFSSRTGVPGIRCAEVAKGFEKEHPWKKWGDETVKGKEKNRKPSERAELIKETAELLNKLPENSKTTLILPLDGGPSFFPVISHEAGEGLESNADINAAVNIGLRAVAHPDCLDVFPIFRAKPSKDGNVEIQKPKRGIYTIIGDTERVLKLCEQKKKEGRQEDEINDPQTAPAAEANEDETPKDADSEKITYLFVCKKNCLTIPDGNCFNFPKHSDVFGATTRIYWSRVKQECLARIRTVNADRLQTVDKDDIPFDCP